jgi:hypothetical protein
MPAAARRPPANREGRHNREASTFPTALVALRTRIFTWINGEEGVAVPGKVIGAARFKELYAQPAANGRSRGAALSDLFWYWLAPGPEIHQEHLEAGNRYEEAARSTKRILAIPREDACTLAEDCVERMLARAVIRNAALVRLRDLMMPVWADFYYQVVFREKCSDVARALIVGNANDVVTALKCCSLRHMGRRRKLTEYLIEKLRSEEMPHDLPASLTLEERALYLQGTFFNTAVVQMSEAMAHLLMAVAKNPHVQSRVLADLEDERYLDHVMSETLRLYPLFGISHRITTAEIRLDEDTVLPKGSVLCFNHLQFHTTGYQDAERFDPDRWEQLAVREANYIPFGVAANRPCPAQRLALITMRAAARLTLKHFALYSTASHTRSIPNRRPCLLVRRGSDARLRRVVLAWLRLRDGWEDVTRSVVQLVLGSYMVWEARRLRMCQRYFERLPSDNSDGGCPFSPPGSVAVTARSPR